MVHCKESSKERELLEYETVGGSVVTKVLHATSAIEIGDIVDFVVSYF